MAKNSSSTTRHNVYQRIYQVVRLIPYGQVATYGQIASVLQLSGGARQVGYALHALSEDSDVPWHRVINAQGRISSRSNVEWEKKQQQLLEEEQITFDSSNRISLNDYQCDSASIRS